MRVHLEQFAVPVSIVEQAADGQPHHILLRFVDLGGAVEVTSIRDGQPSASTQQPGLIPQTVQVELRVGEFISGIVTVGEVACHLI
jgi:hypothetical protein